MKIKGPGNYSGPPPPEPKGDDKKVGKFQPEKHVQQTQDTKAKAKGQAQSISSIEKGLSEVAKTAKAEGLKGEALAAKVVDTVLTEMFGKDFVSRPDAAALRETITPFVAQDEHLSSKLQSLITRLGNKT
ncbi:hypothetical protein L0222_15955 [bacterium]|nr:hypothetical protein [bacterium]MCI0606948.1 hypothetical protein [bacterium]